MKVLRAGALGVLSQAFIPDLLLPLDRSVNKQGNPALSSQVIPLVLAEKADALSNAEIPRAEQSSRALHSFFWMRERKGFTLGGARFDSSLVALPG